MKARKKNGNANARDKLKPATPSTRGNPDDPRWKSADKLEEENEEKLGEHLDPKHDKTGG